MLTSLPLFAISILALMGEIAKADITLKLTTHAEQTAPMPRTLRAGRSRPRRQDTASETDIEARQANSGAAFSMAHAPISLNNQDSRGVLYTVDIEIAGVSLPVLVRFPHMKEWWTQSVDHRSTLAPRNSGLHLKIVLIVLQSTRLERQSQSPPTVGVPSCLIVSFSKPLSGISP
jgi:hypothetical protein